MKTKMKDVKTLVLAVLLAAVTLLGSVSCDSPSIMPPDEKSSTVGTLLIEPAVDKALVWTANTEISEYVYKATPLFSGTATGSASDWQHLSFTGSGTIGQLTQGKWYFELQGRNSKGTTITTGSIETYVEAGKDNAVSIQMKTDPTLGVGTVKYNVWIQNVSEKGSVLKVYTKGTDETEFTEVNKHSDVTDGNPHIVGSIAGLKAGYHELLFMLFDESGAVLGGEQIGVQVVTNEVTTISGIVEPSLEVDFEISIKSMGYVHAELFPSDDVTVEGTGRDKTAYIERGDVVSFTWKDLDDATSHPTEFIWALDGEVVESSENKSYSVSYTEYGEHDLSVIGIRRDENGVAWDCGSAVIRIVVVRHICEISFMADGGFFPDGTDIAIMYMDTTVESERKIPGGNPFDGLSPQRTGYRLSAWIDADTEEEVVTIAEDGTVTFLEGFVTKKQTRTLKAVWVAGTYEVTVIWDQNVTVNGEKKESTEKYTIKSGESLSSFLAETPKREGFNFVGYSTEENGRGDTVMYNGTYIWGKNITIWANWEYVPIVISFYKSFSDYENNIAGYKATLVGSDLRYGSLPQPLRQGKVFKGWAHPEDLDMTQYEVTDGVKYLWQDALLSGKNYVQVTDYVRKYYNHSLIAVWGEGDIKISFDTGDATLTAKGQESISKFSQDDKGVYYTLGALGTQYGALPFTDIETEVRAGMEFMGWYDSTTYNVRVYEVSAVTTNSDHTLYAKWEGARIKVSYDTGNGVVLEEKEVRYLGTYGVLPELVRAGYDFGGWTYNGEEITAESTVKATTSHTLVAKWIPKVSTVTLDIAGGMYTDSTTLYLDYEATYKTAVDKSGTSFGSTSTQSGLKEPTRYGYDFAGWYNNPAGNGTAVKGDTVNAEATDQTLYATWKAHTYTITFYNNWPDVSETKGKAATSTKSNIPYGTSYGDLPMLSVTGYTFNGWYTANEGGTRVSATTRYDVDKNISLYARWSITTINISFYEDGVVCKDADGNALAPVQREYGSKYATLPTPYKFGYTFTGKWTIVGRTDSEGNEIYITDSMTVDYVDDITLSPTWTPEKVLVIVTYGITASDTGEISAVDWTGVKTYEVSYGDSINTARAATVKSGKWTAGTETSELPTYTRTGYKQKEWSVIVPGKSKTRTNATAYLLDYGNMETYGKSKYGTVTPDRVIYMAPDWQADTYYTTYVNYVETDNGFVLTEKAPSKQSVAIDYDETLGEVLGEDDTQWVLDWTGYGCAGYYSDAALSTEISPETVAGIDIKPNDEGKIVIYCKWQKIRTRLSISTDSYYATRNEHFLVSDILSGTANGLYDGADGWYDFSGWVDDVYYTKLRKGNGNLEILRVEDKGEGGSASWTVPSGTTIQITNNYGATYEFSKKCTVCDGQGYVEIISGNFILYGETWTPTDAPTTGEVAKTTTTEYVASKMYDFCPDGCKDWENHNKYYFEICPNCNGVPSDIEKHAWEKRTVTETFEYCPGHKTTETVNSCPGHVDADGERLYCPDPGCRTYTKETTTKCDGCKTGTSTTTKSYYVDQYCYCIKQTLDATGESKPGYIALSGHRLEATKKSDVAIKVSGTIVRTEGQKDSFTVTEGQRITITMTPPTDSDTSLVIDETIDGLVSLTDTADEDDVIEKTTPDIVLCGSGSGEVLVLEYNHYDRIGTRYAVSNGNAKTSRTTPYYSYGGYIYEAQYADTTGNKCIKSTQSSMGLVTSDKIDYSLPMSCYIVTEDGRYIYGTISTIAWTYKTLSVTVGGTTFDWDYREYGKKESGTLVKSFSLYCWLKPEAQD